MESLSLESLLVAKNSDQCARHGFISLSVRVLRAGKPVAALTSVVTLGSFESLTATSMDSFTAGAMVAPSISGREKRALVLQKAQSWAGGVQRFPSTFRCSIF